ncbi:integrase catalytic domain-containing protein [Trichonephila inaurata madagascariensis]|uniref:Integrase catalytic domain-containing protein n=1 Tax=Trichonephila inaurata madagascariensis TaxID=2747483 RepID=A0A8X7CAY4_9ARAC|nr:integrase catalytic domain-containing protein [Trichonephila inaurata madagascariensis]
MSAEAKRTFKLIMLNVVDATFKAEFFQKFSSLNKLKRVVAYCLRFVKNCSLSASKRRKSFLTTAELSEAENAIVKFIQRDHFSIEVSYLSEGKQLSSTNKLIPLTPFYDDSEIIPGLKRFVALRGKPSEIFCDQGTNFYGASRDVRKEFRQLMKEDAVHRFLESINSYPTVPDDLRHCDRWRLLTRMTQHFWNRWSSEYLTLLQSRSKCRIVQKYLDIGDLVLIKHDNSPPLQWKLGKVKETFPGKDGKVRVVKVKTQTSELVRPITKLCPLPINT